MARRKAEVTQAQIARAIRAAKKHGASRVEIEPDGKITFGDGKGPTEVIETEPPLVL